jgi:hypothetical protein
LVFDFSFLNFFIHTPMSNVLRLLDVGHLTRRCLFFVVLVILTLANLFVMFRGLNTPQAMDQAQIAREISRGNGYTTKMIRPAAYYQAEKAQNQAVSFTKFEDTYHAPLNPLILSAVFKMIGADQPDAMSMDKNQMIFPLDRVVATVSTIFFLLAIGVNYLLIVKIFDAKIAGVCAILMLFCDVFWQFSLSGLPQMLMLFLFSCGMYFVYRAVEEAVEDRLATVPALIAGVFFTLLAFTHWVTIWISLGYILYAAIVFRPRGMIGLGLLLMILIPGAYIIYRNYTITGTPFGTAFLTLYNGLGDGVEVTVMRNPDLADKPLVLDGLIRKVLAATLLQTREIIPLLAGIVVAPVFFLSLLHPFKRTAISRFRWAILIMWASGAFGLAFFGITDKPLDPNQIHLLFAPIMTAYGVAMISILWTRLEFVAMTPMLRNTHHFIVIGICSLPMVLEMPFSVRLGLTLRDRGGYPSWPPYFAPVLNNKAMGLRGIVNETDLIFSDQPWAVAWYADRTNIWLPTTKEGFSKFETLATSMRTPTVGILISPSSHGSGNVTEVTGLYRDFAALVLDGPVIQATYPPGFTIFEKSPKLQEVASHYPYRHTLMGAQMIYYSDRMISSPER